MVRHVSAGNGEEVSYTERMADIATMLAADGYNLAVEENGQRVALTVSPARTPARTAWCPRTCSAASPRTSSASRAT